MLENTISSHQVFGVQDFAVAWLSANFSSLGINAVKLRVILSFSVKSVQLSVDPSDNLYVCIYATHVLCPLLMYLYSYNQFCSLFTV